MTANNPAGRLYIFLHEARRKSQTDKVRQIWAEMFDVDPRDTGEILSIHADLIDLINEASLTVKRADELDDNLYLKAFNQIEKAFATANLEVQWKQVRNQIDDATMARLELVADNLGRLAPEKVADEDELEKLATEVEALIENVINGDIPQQLKTVILESLEAIRRAIRNYRLGGIKGLVNALTRSAGVVIVHRGILRDSEDSTHVNQFFKVLGHLNQIVALALNTQSLLGPAVENLLPPGVP